MGVVDAPAGAFVGSVLHGRRRASATSSPRVGPGPIPDTYLAHERLKIALLATFNLRAIQAKIRVSSLKHRAFWGRCGVSAAAQRLAHRQTGTQTHRGSRARGNSSGGVVKELWAAAPETPTAAWRRHDAALAKRCLPEDNDNDGVPERAPAAAAAGAAAARARCFNCRERLELLAAQPHLCARECHPAAVFEGVRERGLRARV